MSAIGWTALVALGTKVIAQSNALQELLSYTRISIGVCASVAALIVLARPQLGGPIPIQVSQDHAAMFKSLADQMRFAETRARVLALAKRFEETQKRGQ